MFQNGTKRPERVKQDIESFIPILFNLNVNIEANPVRYCFRLGKFKKDQSRPCPLLLKLNQVIDVITVLSNRSPIKHKILLLNQICPLKRGKLHLSY